MGTQTLYPMDDDYPLIRNIYNDKSVRIDLADFDDDEIEVDYNAFRREVTVSALHDETKEDDNSFYCGSSSFNYSFYIPDWAYGIDYKIHEGMVSVTFKKED